MSAESIGSLLAIPTGDHWGLAKVIFASEYFADTILIKLFHGKCRNLDSIKSDAYSGEFSLYYTSAEPIKKGRWKSLYRENVSGDERALSKRTSGGEVWVEDTHLGAASDGELLELPKMLVHGYKLIEKHAGRMESVD